MRPWTLIDAFACEHVPSLRHLHHVPLTRRIRAKCQVHKYARGWEWYIRGNIVSHHQERLIKSFMALNSGKSSTDAELDAAFGVEHTSTKATLQYDNTQTVAFVHGLLRRMAAADGEKVEEKEMTSSMQTALNKGDHM